MFVSLLLAVALGADLSDARAGRWYPNVYRSPGTEGLSAERRAELAQLEALGYLGGSTPDDAAAGVTVWDRAAASPGVNLYNSGHAAEARLIGLDGQTLHTWSMPFETAFPDLPSTDVRATGAWRRVALRPSDGHLLGVYEGLGLVHLDAASRIVWTSANRAHHDARWRPDGGVWVLTRVLHAVGGPGGRPLLEDFVAELDREGRELRRVSVLLALSESPWASLLERAPTDSGDLLHTNALFPLDVGPSSPESFSGPRRVLLSMRHLDALAVLDLDEQRILWTATGVWSRQHDVEITPSGAMLLFDNQGDPTGTSWVRAFEPWSMRPLWSWGGSVGRPLVSEVLGGAQELPNGNVLVTESTRGRAVEVTPKGRVVWEYHNPEVTGANGAFVAAIFDLTRIPPTTPLPWLTP